MLFLQEFADESIDHFNHIGHINIFNHLIMC